MRVRGPVASAVMQAYNGSLGAKAPGGSRGRVPGQEVRDQSPREAESFKVRRLHQYWVHLGITCSHSVLATFYYSIVKSHNCN